MISDLKKIIKEIKKEIRIYHAIMKDPRTPLISRILLWTATAYLLLPFDVIPDWIPLLGQADDIILVTSCVFLAMQFVPEQVVSDCRNANQTSTTGTECQLYTL